MACSALAIAPLSARSGAHANPVGRTMSLRAPRAIAVLTGVLLAMAPSHSGLPSISTGSKAAGIAVLARIACVTGPRDSTTALPVRASEATRHRKDRVLHVAIGQVPIEKISEPVGRYEMAAPANKTEEPAPGPGKDSLRLRPHQSRSDLEMPSKVGSPAK